MLKLVKTDLHPITEQRLVRMTNDARALASLPPSEARAAYAAIEVLRDRLSRLLDRMDDKHV
jgi:hypothetical protein